MKENFYKNFNQLGAAETPPPMHLFDEIDRRRGFFHRLGNYAYVYKTYLLGGVGAVLLLAFLGNSVFETSTDSPTGRVVLSGFETSIPENTRTAPQSVAPTGPVLSRAGTSIELEPSSSEEQFFGSKPAVLGDFSKKSTTTSSVSGKENAEIYPKKPAVPTEPVAVLNSRSEITGGSGESEADLLAPTTLPNTPSLLELKLPDPLGCYWGGSGTDIDYSLELLASGLYDFRELTPRSPEDQTYADDRNQTEDAWYGFGGTFRASVLLNEHVALRLGLDYQQINERFRYNEPGETRIVTEEIFGPDGEVIGTTTDTVVGVRNVQWTNQYRMIGVPAMIGYEMDFGNFLLTLNGGASFNVATARRGRILTPGGDIGSIDTGTPDADDPPAAGAYKTLVGTSLIGSIGLNYELRSDLYLVVEPQFRYYLKSFTKMEFPVEHRHANLGLQFGLRVDL